MNSFGIETNVAYGGQVPEYTVSTSGHNNQTDPLAIGEHENRSLDQNTQNDILNQATELPSEEDNDNERKPDPDALKMFVGQIPKDWGESDCRQLLEPFGEIYLINILRDKETKKNRGCCFVTYYTRKAALEAQNALHNLRKLPSCRNPIQMKPADNENKNDRKLFVGKVPKFIKEADISNTFSKHGVVEECVVLRDNNGTSKGCAFVTFSTRSSAADAIRMLHQSKPFEGCVNAIVVKFADASSKDLKKQQSKNGTGNGGSGAGLISAVPQAMQAYMTGSSLLDNSNSYLELIKAQQQQQLMSLAALPQPYLTPEMAYANSILLTNGNKLPLLPNQLMSNTSATTATNKLLTSDPLASSTTLPALGCSYAALNVIAKHYSSVTNSKQAEGPEGANLFIYHLPAEYTDVDLVNLFSPFGKVISAKVFIDKNSHLSKCFGFVSYDNAESAQMAIRSMNGFQILNKRLKVQLKKVRDKPY